MPGRACAATSARRSTARGGSADTEAFLRSCERSHRLRFPCPDSRRGSHQKEGGIEPVPTPRPRVVENGAAVAFEAHHESGASTREKTEACSKAGRPGAS